MIDLMVTKNVIWNQHNEPVMTTWTSLAARPGMDVDPELEASLDHVMMKIDAIGDPGHTVKAPAGRYELPDPTKSPDAYAAVNFDTLSVGQELPAKRYFLTRGQSVQLRRCRRRPEPDPLLRPRDQRGRNG